MCLPRDGNEAVLLGKVGLLKINSALVSLKLKPDRRQNVNK